MSREEDVPADPFGRAYEFVRRELAAGRWGAGSQIRVDETAKSLRISPTPVREALAKLAGERLVRRSRRHGYFAPRLDAGELIELYDLEEVLLLAAIAAWPPPPTDADTGSQERTAPEHGVGLGSLFILILTRSRNAALQDAGTLIIDRLAAARLVEDEAVVNKDERMIAELLRARSPDELSRELRMYHSTRRAAALAIAKAIRQREGEKYLPDMV